MPYLAYFRLRVVADVDNSLLPLAGRNLALEQNVDLAVRSALHLRKEEESHDEAEETSTSPDVTALSAKVCLLRFVSNVFRARFWEKDNLTSGLSM